MKKPRYGEKVDRNRQIMILHNCYVNNRKIGELLDVSGEVVGRIIKQIKLRKQDWYKDLINENEN